MRPLIAVLALSLSGCASTPSAMRDKGDPFAVLSLDGEAEAIAKCARVDLLNDPPNAFNPPTPIIAERGGTVSIIGNASDATVYVADLSDNGGSVQATVYASRAYARRQENGEAVVSALRGCVSGGSGT